MMPGCRKTRILLCVLLAAFPSFGQTPRVLNSLLLLIDTSGSMSEEVGNGNAEIKIEAAKQAAIAAVDRALAGRTEVAVLAFDGECDNPVSQQLGFTTDGDRLTRFIDGLQPGGGTPMAEAVLVANRFMQANRSPRANSQMIVLLADGDNACGDVAQAMAELQASGIVFRHETVGFGIEPASDAAHDLRHVATTSGGQYHHAASATQLADVFMEFVDTLTVIDMLGMFGSGAQAGTPGGQGSPTGSGPTTSPPAHDAAQQDTGVVTGMLGMFTADDSGDETAGALAIDSDQGPTWGWAAGYATVAEARQRALDECGEDCEVVVTFEDGCAAYVADQTQGSTVSTWAYGPLDGAEQATQTALDECADRGGDDCVVRVWACGDGTGGGLGGASREPDSASDGMATEGRKDGTAGALAIDSEQGSEWAYAAGYATVAEARRDLLEDCGDTCQVVVTFEDGCAAYAADQTPDSTVSGWGVEFDTAQQAADAALDECADRGGQDCIVRVWACSDGLGGGEPDDD